MIARPLAIVERAAIFQQARLSIALDGLGAQDFGQTPFVLAAPPLHLPQTILGHDVALREEQIVDVLRVDVRNAPQVTDHIDRLPQARDSQVAVNPGQRLPREYPDIRRRLAGRSRSGDVAAARGEEGCGNDSCAGEHDSKHHRNLPRYAAEPPDPGVDRN